jgi:hypothetical protein
VIASDETSEWMARMLLPVCSADTLPNYRRTPFAFRIVDGFVLFQMNE